ncbi:MAG: peptidoglycan DD-metalloendopeptidase family protein [Deltaproteobacteria bacterium]|nr:peptidoglycan DD-metalloendopeptidase family protein [Deltaproteobacteria bacterium]
MSSAHPLKFLLGFIAAFLVVPLTVSAQAPDQHERLKEINAQVETAGKQLAATTQREAALSVEYKELEKAVAELRSQENKLRGSLEGNLQTAHQLRDELEENKKKLSALKLATAVRLKVLYMHRHQSVAESVLLVSDHSTLQKHAYFLEKIRTHDMRLFDQIQVLLLEKAGQARKLADTIEQQARIKRDISSQKSLLSKKLEQQNNVLKELRAERARLESAVVSLRAQALRLETVLVSITGNDAEESRLSLPRDGGSTQSRQVVQQYLGAGLAGQRGKIRRPVAGSAVQQKGEKASNFKDMVSRKGVRFACDGKESVKVVADGRVIYVGRMPGLGNLAIVDHGKRYYTLYGGIDSPLVNLGNDVREGDTVAECGTEEQGAPELYFEIRKNGSPVNVKEYLLPG